MMIIFKKNKEEDIINLTLGVEPAQILLNTINEKIYQLTDDSGDRPTLMCIAASIRVDLARIENRR
jgi:hypothetical protein